MPLVTSPLPTAPGARGRGREAPEAGLGPASTQERELCHSKEGFLPALEGILFVRKTAERGQELPAAALQCSASSRSVCVTHAHKRRTGTPRGLASRGPRGAAFHRRPATARWHLKGPAPLAKAASGRAPAARSSTRTHIPRSLTTGRFPSHNGTALGPGWG